MLWEKYKWFLTRYWKLSLLGGVGVAGIGYGMKTTLLGKENPYYHKPVHALGFGLFAALLPAAAGAVMTSDNDYKLMRAMEAPLTKSSV